jgi:hypothetical protein
MDERPNDKRFERTRPLHIHRLWQMADLQLTSAVLDELKTAFSGFAGRVGQACDDIRTGDGGVSGDDPLSGYVHDFAGSWNYGLGQLSTHGQQCVTMLRKVGSTFDQLDQHLASEIAPAKEHG